MNHLETFNDDQSNVFHTDSYCQEIVCFFSFKSHKYIQRRNKRLVLPADSACATKQAKLACMSLSKNGSDGLCADLATARAPSASIGFSLQQCSNFFQKVCIVGVLRTLSPECLQSMNDYTAESASLGGKNARNILSSAMIKATTNRGRGMYHVIIGAQHMVDQGLLKPSSGQLWFWQPAPSLFMAVWALPMRLHLGEIRTTCSCMQRIYIRDVAYNLVFAIQVRLIVRSLCWVST